MAVDRTGSRYQDVDREENMLRTQAACVAFYAKIDEYFDAGKYTDVSITCEDRVFRCHRLVLAAASEYFDAMLGGNFRESCTGEVVLHGIDLTSFESVLRFMYKGIVPVIGDENVFSLLRTATILNLRIVEERCMHYLTERSVPINDAREIFSYALAIRDKRLISCASQCILKHLAHFSTDGLFLEMSFDGLSTLLEFASREDSSEAEAVLLNFICRWVSNLTCSLQEKESIFFKLTQNISFKHIPLIFSDVHNADTAFQYDLDVIGSEITDCNPSLHAYIKMLGHSDHTSSCVAVFSSEETGGLVKWRSSHNIRPLQEMRTVVCNNRLYSFQSAKVGMGVSFISSTSVDFSKNYNEFTTDPISINAYTSSWGPSPLSMCSCWNGIYACFDGSLFHYNCEQDKWLLIPFVTKRKFVPHLITICHNQLYMIGDNAVCEERWRAVQTYDERTGKLQAVSSSKLMHTYDDEVCTHKERIYRVVHFNLPAGLSREQRPK